MKSPFLNATGAAAYIVVIVSVLQGMSVLLKSQEGTFVIPMAMLSMFVLSAAIMGYFFLTPPLFLVFENKKKEAVVYFGKIVGFFACYAALFGIIVIITSTIIK